VTRLVPRAFIADCDAEYAAVVGFHGSNFRLLAALVHGDLPAQTLGASASSPEGRGPSAILAASPRRPVR